LRSTRSWRESVLKTPASGYWLPEASSQKPEAVFSKLYSGETYSTHGKYKQVEQRGTEESQARRAQEKKDGKSAEASRIRARLGEAQSEEDGTRHGEAVDKEALGNCHLVIRGESGAFGGPSSAVARC
jgi:hypothetical protein